MPSETRWFAKAAMFFLFLTFAVGAAMTFARNGGVAVPGIIAVEHAHLGFVGFLVNMVIGIALSMLPADRDRYPQTRGRYPARAPIACWLLLNAGLIARVVVEPFQSLRETPALAFSALLDIAAVAQLVAIVIFVSIAWHRIRPAAAERFGTRA